MVTKGEKPRADASSESDGSRSGSGHEVGRFPGSPAGVEEGSPKRCVSEGSLDAEDLEIGALSEIDQKRGGGGGGEKPDKGKPSKAAAERDCRICHLGLESASPESGLAIELGCSCKDDLGAAHRQCAETWFKIRGNKTCEICGTIARNVVGSGETEFIEQWNESNNATATPASTTEARPFWQGHRFLNFLLACLVFAFIISWLFHFNVPG
ncbi:hypothetical protein ACMD2_11060 [Ananas comosus]|uniref:RING-CH-type domain-containing protein n=1 Tax=Ananas comosus TaxID=4615 RepID=A0A199VMC6_ANACO|nr:hypothetical protein ACMD2_11060 [Ananas comosus]